MDYRITNVLAAALVLCAVSQSTWASVKLIEPVANHQSASPFPHFTWTEHPAAFMKMDCPVRYEIQIAADEVFESIVDEDTVYLNRYVHDRPFAVGSYYWRVRAVPYGQSPAAWSEARRFMIAPCDEVITVSLSSDSHDHAKGIQQAVAQTASLAEQGKSVRLVFPPGDYHIKESMQGALIVLDGVADIVIDGTGARLHLTSRKQGLIRANNCENIAIMGFSTSYRKGALRIQGYVKAVDQEQQKVTVSIEPGFPDFSASDNPGGDIFYLLEPNTDGRLKTGALNFFRVKGGFSRNADNTWTFSIGRPVDAWEVGDRYCYNFRGGSMQFIDFGQSRSMTAYGLTTGGWGGMQFVSIEGSLFNILNCSTTFDEGKWMTGNADGVHIRGHEVGPWIERLQIQAIGDDSVALYARPASIRSLTPRSRGPENTAICKEIFFNLEPGDDVSFFQPLEGAILLETRVETVVPVEGGFQVTFRDPLPTNLKIDGPLVKVTQIWNRSKSCGDFMVRNSKFTNIRRYGTVFRSKRGVVENTTYTGVSTRSIVFINGTQWPNGLYASEIIVRNNTISDSGFDHPSMPAVIAFLFNGYRRGATTIGPRNILIEGNTIENTPSPEIELSWVKNAVLRNNRIKLASGKIVPAKYKASNSAGITEGR